MTITVNEMLYKIASRLRPMYYGEADDMGFDTPSTPTTLVDFSRTEASQFFTGGTIFLLDASYEAKKITSYVYDSSQGSPAGTFTFAERDSIYTGPYAAVDKKYTRDVLMHALNMALGELGPFVQLDQTLTVELGAEEYTLPTGVKNLLRVQIAESTDGDTWDSPHRYWRERNGSLWFDDEYLPDTDGAPIRLYYEAAHARVDDGEDEITDAIHPDVIATLAAIHAIRMRLPAVGSSDPEPAALLQMLVPQYQGLRVQNPKRTMQRDSRFPVIPALEPTGGYTSSSDSGGGDGDGGSSDTTAPDTPTGLAVVSTDVSEVALAWTDSNDNIGVSGYRIYRDGSAIGTVAVAAYTDTGLTASTSYVYEVTAYDAAGNESAHSSSVTATTTADLGDTEAPTAPSNLTVGVETTTTVPLTWTAATDNVAVDHYIVYRDGTGVANVTGTSYTDVDLVPETSYVYTVTAVDAAGNESAASGSATGTTEALTGADTWFVATNGSALNAGTEAAPWTLDHALNGAAGATIGPGDIVYLRAGTYTVTAAQVVDALTGTNTDHITIRAYPGERVTIRNNGTSVHNTLEIQDVSYTDFMGIEFTAYQYTRATIGDTAVDMSHVYENPANTQDHIQWLDCRFHDSPGRAMRLAETSTNITVEGCLFYYNGSGSPDYTLLVQNAAAGNKVIRKNVFIHNSSDDLRLFSDTAGGEEVQDIDLLDNFILNTGGLWNDPARSILIGAEVATPTGIVVDDNVIYNRQTADGNSRAYQVGNIGASSSGSVSVQISSTADDFVYTDDGLVWGTSNTLQVGAPNRSAGWRFLNITIPQGATITSAVFTAEATNTGLTGDTVVARIRADKSSVNPSAPTDAGTAIARTKTTAYVDWTIGETWATGDKASADISTVIQEIVDQGTWASGNALILYLSDSGSSTDDIWFRDRSANAATAGRLAITYETVAADGGADTVTADSNIMIGQPVDLTGSGYTGVTFTNNGVTYSGSHVGTTESSYASNTWTGSYPSSGTQVYTKVLDHNDRKANLLIINWAGATSVSVSDAQLGTLNLAAGDTYTLANMENFYSDRITGIYNGTSITIPLTGRSQAGTYGDVGTPTTMYPTVGIFQIISVEGNGGALPPTIPTGLAANASGTSVNLSWNHSSGDVAGYTVYRDGAVIGTTAQNQYTDSGLTPGQSYDYQVDAYSSVGVHSAPTSTVSVSLDITGYFVSASGSAAGTGAIGSPWSLAFMLAGANGAIGPGDTVWVRGGTYSLSGTTYINLDGTSASPISVRAYPDETPLIRISNNSSTALYINNAQYTHFYDLVFTHTGYTRTNQQTQGTYEGAILGVTAGGTGVKFYGCHFKNAPTHGTRAFEHAGTVEYNGCIWTFNGANEQFDHGVYCRNETDTPVVFRDSIMAHNAGHGFHGYQSGGKYGNDITLDGCLIFQNGSLYDQQTRQSLIGSTQYPNTNNTITENIVYSNLGVDSNADAFRLGYGAGHTGCTIARNYFVGNPVYLESGSNYDVNSNYLYYGSGSASQRANTASIMNAGSNNTMAAIPTGVDPVVQVRAYNWNPRRANIAVLNWDSDPTVTVTHAELIAAGVTIANGETYELHNAENYHGDIVTGTYNGSSISLPMTGRTVETPYGLPKPDSAFPKFGAFVLVTKP